MSEKLFMNVKLRAIATLFALLLPFVSVADQPQAPPDFLQLVAGLRDARWTLQHRPGEIAFSTQEGIALSEIDRAIDEIFKAAQMQDKIHQYRPHDDINQEHSERLHRALDLLENARRDLAIDVESDVANQYRRRALEHVSRAVDATKFAIREDDRRIKRAESR